MNIIIGVCQGILGDQGPKGEVGPQGPIGLQGPTGDVGVNGTEGDLGITGDLGEEGIEGECEYRNPDCQKSSRCFTQDKRACSARRVKPGRKEK